MRKLTQLSTECRFLKADNTSVYFSGSLLGLFYVCFAISTVMLERGLQNQTLQYCCEADVG
jgi:hypothetical protein